MTSVAERDLGLSGLFLPPLARGLIRTLGATIRLTIKGGENLDWLEERGRRAVLAFFHGRQFLLVYALRRRRIGIMSSLSRDGELQARTLEGLGYRIVRGSSSRSGARALIGMLHLMEQGHHASVAVDGPRGPRQEVKPGAVYLAKKAGAPVVPLASSARPARVFRKAWDRYLLPWPGSKGVVLIGEPVRLDGDISDQALERDGRMLREKLLALQEEADRMAGRIA